MSSELIEKSKEPIKEKAPKWLRQLQLHSWEPEILLSGIVLYGLFQTPELLDKALVFLKVNFSGNTSDINNLIALLKVAIYWLTLGLILHLISRGIWVGMVGLSFTFPKGINYDHLKFSPKFRDHLEKIPSMTSIIISLEKLCSSLFSISFMLFMSMIGGYFYMLVLIIIPLLSYVFLILDGNFGGLNVVSLTIYILLIMTIGIIGLIDFLTLGFLKKYKWLSKVFWPIYRFVGILTLSRLYRPIYYSIVSNYNKWKISAFLIFFVVVSIFMVGNIANATYPGDNISRINMWNNRTSTAAFNGYYDDQNTEDYSLVAHLQSDIIRGNTLRFFVVSRADREESIQEFCGYDSLMMELDTAKQYIDLHCIKTFYQVYIDDSLLTDLEWKFHFKSHTKQKGLLTWIGIRHLDEGLHYLRLKGPDEKYSYDLARIPFYREINANTYIPAMQPAIKEEDLDYMKLKPILPK